MYSGIIVILFSSTVPAPALAMTVDPSTAMLTAGTAAVITCAIGINDAVDPSDYSIDVEWLAPGGIQVSPGGRYMESEIQSVGSNSYVSKLSITPVVQSDNGLFRCAVTVVSPSPNIIGTSDYDEEPLTIVGMLLLIAGYNIII